MKDSESVTIIDSSVGKTYVMSLSNSVYNLTVNGESQAVAMAAAGANVEGTTFTYVDGNYTSVWIWGSGTGGGGSSGGVGGDPYVSTILNQFYKLDNITGFCRMLQGTVNDKNFIINVEMILDSAEVEDDMNRWANSLEQFNELHKVADTSQHMQSFITRVFDSIVDNSKFLFDIQNFLVVFSEGNDIIYTSDSNPTSVKSCIKVYEDSPDSVMNVKCGDFTLCIIRYPNKQLRRRN